MPETNAPHEFGHRIALFICLLAVSSSAATMPLVIPKSQDGLGQITCERPVRLAHDCSIWQGATRPIAIGGFRMTLAADGDGRTVLVSRIRPGPDHTARQFNRGERNDSRVRRSLRAIEQIGSIVEREGIQLERLQPLGSGHTIEGWFLEFSGNAYNYLKQFTVLESEYWLPPRRAQ